MKRFIAMTALACSLCTPVRAEQPLNLPNFPNAIEQISRVLAIMVYIDQECAGWQPNRQAVATAWMQSGVPLDLIKSEAVRKRRDEILVDFYRGTGVCGVLLTNYPELVKQR